MIPCWYNDMVVGELRQLSIPPGFDLAVPFSPNLSRGQQPASYLLTSPTLCMVICDQGAVTVLYTAHIGQWQRSDPPCLIFIPIFGHVATRASREAAVTGLLDFIGIPKPGRGGGGG